MLVEKANTYKFSYKYGTSSTKKFISRMNCPELDVIFGEIIIF